MNSFGPFESTRSFNNEIVLSVVNHDFAFSPENFFYKMNVRLHEIFIHGFVNISGLLSEFDVPSQSKKSLDVIVSKVLVDDYVRVLSVLGNVVDVNTTCHFNDQFQSFIKSVMQVSPVPASFLESPVQNYLLNG